MVAELRGHERQAAAELGQRKTGVRESKPLDASRAAIALELAASIVGPVTTADTVRCGVAPSLV